MSQEPHTDTRQVIKNCFCPLADVVTSGSCDEMVLEMGIEGAAQLFPPCDGIRLSRGTQGDEDTYTEFFSRTIATLHLNERPFETFDHPVVCLLVVTERDSYDDARQLLVDYKTRPVPEYTSINDVLPLFVVVGQDHLSLDLKRKLYADSVTFSHAAEIDTAAILNKVQTFMAHKVAAWDESVLAPRRSISRFFKKWGTNNHHEVAYTGKYYLAGSQEQTLRKLGDWAFMLGDYAKAQLAYEIVKKDADPTAIEYTASAEEWCAVTLLLLHKPIEQLMEQCTYDYVSRCGAPALAMRAIVIIAEVYQLRCEFQQTIKWLNKLLTFVQLPRERALILERISTIYKLMGYQRKAALWLLLASKEWSAVGVRERVDNNMIECSIYENLDIGQRPGLYTRLN